MTRDPRLTKRLIIVGICLIVVFGGLYGFDAFRRVMTARYFASFKQPPVPVTVEQVQVGEVPRSVEAIGSLEAVQQVTLAPEVSGRITALHFQPGSEVKAGAPLVQLNDGPDRGDLERLRAQARLAGINLERSKKLLPLAAAQSDVDAGQANLDSINGEIARTEALIAQKAITAPFGGRLGVQRVHLGEYVNAGTALVTLTNLDALYLNLTLPEQWYDRLHVGQPVTFSVDALPGRQFSARILAIDPQIGTDTRAVTLQARFENPKHELAPGMFARAALQLPPEEGAITIPALAIDFSIHGDSAFVIHRQKDAQGEHVTVSRVLLHTDGRVGDRVVVTKGLKAGDTVVTGGQVKLHEGADVKIVQDATLEEAARQVRGRLQ